MRKFIFVAVAAFLVIAPKSVLAQKAGTPPPVMPPNTISQHPWFTNPQVQRQMKLTTSQYDKLNQSHNKSLQTYQQKLADYNKLTPTEKQQYIDNLAGNFYGQFNTSAQGILQPAQWQRFQQLHWQQQGYNAFFNPQMQQKLDLNAQQREQLQGARTTYHQEMSKFDPNQPGAARTYLQYQNQMNKNINTILTPRQRQAWAAMTGEPYQFPMPNGANTPSPKQPQ